MRRLATAASIVALAFGLSACGSDPAAPTNLPAIFNATLLPANEVPAVAGAESGGSGTVTITVNLTKDAAGAITAATANFTVTVTGFPAGMTLTAAHIHPGNTGVVGSPIVNLALTAGEISFATGSGSFTKTGITVTVAQADAMMVNAGGFYFNIHTSANPGGVARGQLARTQ